MASGESLLTLTPNMGVAPATNGAQIDIHPGASTPAENFPCWDFDAASSEYLDFPNLVMPKEYDGGGLTIIVYFATPGEVTVTDEVRWEIALRLIDDAVDPLSTSHTYVYNGVSADPPSVANEVAYEAGITFTDGADMDSVVAEKLFSLRIYRDHDHGDDTATGDAELFAILIKET